MWISPLRDALQWYSPGLTICAVEKTQRTLGETSCTDKTTDKGPKYRDTGVQHLTQHLDTEEDIRYRIAFDLMRPKSL